MIDSHGRVIDYMRISITDRCNLRCQYCMPDNVETMSHADIMRFEEIITICKSASELGIKKFKVTGGEPLVRKGCIDFLRELKQLPLVEQVTLTTNGVLLGEHLEELKAIGIDGINISLDTLDAKQYAQITGRDEFDKVIASIIKCQSIGIRTKVNAVLIKGVNEDQFIRLTELAKDYKIDVRFIEVMPIGYGKKYSGFDRKELLTKLKDSYPDYSIDTQVHGNGPANYVKIADFMGSIGFIDAIHGKFCDKCNRIRLTSDGILKLCLYYENGINLKKFLREGATEEEITKKMKDIIMKKPLEHQFHSDATEGEEESKKMSEIGG